MGLSTPPHRSDTLADEVSLDDAPAGGLRDESGPHWLWVLVRSTGNPPQQVWVRYVAEEAPEGRATKSAAPPTPGSLGVAIVSTPELLDAPPGEVARRRYRRRVAPPPPTDRNLVTAQDFAAIVGCCESSVFQLISLGLPSIKSPKIGRRILKEQALAWLIAGGARKSKVALRLAKAARRAKTVETKGDANGSR